VNPELNGLGFLFMDFY